MPQNVQLGASSRCGQQLLHGGHHLWVGVVGVQHVDAISERLDRVRQPLATPDRHLNLLSAALLQERLELCELASIYAYITRVSASQARKIGAWTVWCV